MLVECEDCKQKFEIVSDETENNITHKKEYKIEGQSIFLTYYDCPSCGRRHYVQIDDVTSIGMLEKTKKQFVTLAVAKKKDKKVSQKTISNFKKTRKDLSNYRMNLMKKYSDKTVYDNDSGSYFVLRFSI